MAKSRNPRGVFSIRSSRSSSPPWSLILAALLCVCMFLFMLLAFGIFSLPDSSDNAPKSDHTTIHGRLVAEKEGMGTRGKQWTEILSWEPRVFIYHNFLSRAECEYLIKLAEPHMTKSTVVDSTTGKSKDSRVRTSSGTFLQRGQDDVIKAIEKRIADFTFIPVAEPSHIHIYEEDSASQIPPDFHYMFRIKEEHGEGLQILHYEVGQKYEPHFDYFLDEFNTKNGGQRIATLLMYLSDVEEGGETVFPSATKNSSSFSWYNELSECGKNGLSVKPKMGDALLFWSMKPDATLDPSSLHGGCPVIKGNKWSSTKWMHIYEYKV